MTPITVYGRPMCPMLPMTRFLLSRAKVPYTYINIYVDEAARERVRQINNGNESVPTLLFSDQSSLTEPTPDVLRTRLNQLGYVVPVSWADAVVRRFPLITLIVGIVVGALLGGALGNTAVGVALGVAAGFMINTAILQVAGR